MILSARPLGFENINCRRYPRPTRQKSRVAKSIQSRWRQPVRLLVRDCRHSRRLSLRSAWSSGCPAAKFDVRDKDITLPGIWRWQPHASDRTWTSVMRFLPFELTMNGRTAPSVHRVRYCLKLLERISSHRTRTGHSVCSNGCRHPWLQPIFAKRAKAGNPTKA